MNEDQKEIPNLDDNKSKVLNTNEIKELEKDIENYMKFKVARNQKTSLVDPLDILVKEPSLIPIEKQLEKYKDKSGNKDSKKEIKVKKYNSGFEINYFLDKNGEMEISSINENSIDSKTIEKFENSLESNLGFYITKLYSKMNYSPIIKKIFGKKITFAELEELAVLWRFYVEIKIKKDEKLISEFKEKLLKIMTDNIKLLIKHIFSIIRIREAIYTIKNVFQNHYFYILKK